MVERGQIPVNMNKEDGPCKLEVLESPTRGKILKLGSSL